MNSVPFDASDVTPSESGGYVLASCEPYWLLIHARRDEDGGWIFFWDGARWVDDLGSPLLYDKAGAEAAASVLPDAKAVNMADYIRFDRRVAGYPRHQAGEMRHAGSAEALTEIYRVVMGSEPE